MMLNGTTKPVEDVAVGDFLLGPDGCPRLVRSLARGRERLYRVTPTKGDPYVVNESHVLSLKRTGTDEVVNITVREYLRRSATFKHVHKGWRAKIDFFYKTPRVPVDPYFLGLWLGDGNSHNATVTTGDAEIVAFLQRHAQSIGMRCETAPNSENSQLVKTLGLTRTGRGGTNLMNALRALGVVNNKHIPECYKIASRADRLRLLAGLIDSDGHYTGKGYDVCLGSERLFDDTLFVARSLGLSAYKAAATKTCHNNGAVGSYWRTTISGHLDEIPCLLPRKQARPRRQKKSVLLTGIRVEPLGVGDYYGFDISGDRLFLLGDFTVTHNTFVFSRIVSAVNTGVVAIAHRAELVSQMSLALAREQVRHRIIGPASLARECVGAQMDELKRNYVDPNARVAAAGVDTLIGMTVAEHPWLAQVGLWVQDEAHHVLRENKWGKVAALFPNALGLGVTATPLRADGKGLGRHADGLFDTMIVGPTMRDLINDGFLTDYRIFAPPSDIDLASIPTTASGDYSPPKLSEARRRSRITGDVVAHYLRIAPGKLGVTFDVDVESATATAQAFKAAGVPAEVVHGKTPGGLRRETIRRFRDREILQLVNVDLFGEGFDLPAIEVVSMARPTQSYGLFAQQFGRSLRPLQGKSHAIIIDHVGNVLRHGLPDARREWSLDRRERRSRSAPTDVLPLRTCLNTECLSVYERVLVCCPYCGHYPTPADRSSPEKVDGDLHELDPGLLARMRGEVDRIDGAPVYPPSAGPAVAGAIKRNHWERQQSQHVLRHAMSVWAGWQAYLGRGVAEAHRRFFHRFGLDVATAQTLGTNEAAELAARINGDLDRHNIREMV